MSDLKTCPACGTEIDERLDQCPECGLKGLKQIFLSWENRQDWVREVLEPHRQWYEEHSEKALKTPCRVFAGQNFALFLTKGGRLYGFGSNDTNSIAPGEEREVRTPVLMAENIASAAAGYNYSIFLGKDGRIRLAGQSPIPYSRCLQFLGCEAVAVYADASCDTFWLRTKDGQLLSFGCNLREQIAPRRDDLVYAYPEISLKVHYSGEFVTHSHKYGTEGFRPYASYGGYNCSDGGSLLNDQVLRFKNTPQYRHEVEGHYYSDCNLDLRFRSLPEKTRIVRKNSGTKEQRSSNPDFEKIYVESRDKVQEEFFVPEIHSLNRYIFSALPVPEGKYHDPDRYLRGSGLVESTETFSGAAHRKDVPDRLLDTDQKVCFASGSVACILTGDHCLDLEDKDVVKDLVSCEPYGRKRVLDGVLDCSAVEGTVYLLREDGRIFQTTTEDLWELASWDDFREVPVP